LVLIRAICKVTAIPTIIKIKGMYQVLENKNADTTKVNHRKPILVSLTFKGTPFFVL